MSERPYLPVSEDDWSYSPNVRFTAITNEHKVEGALEQLAAGWKRGLLLGTLLQPLLEELQLQGLHCHCLSMSCPIRLSDRSRWRERR